MFEYDDLLQCPVGSPVSSDGDIKSQSNYNTSFDSDSLLVGIMSFKNQHKVAVVCKMLCANNHCNL